MVTQKHIYKIYKMDR